MYLPLEIVSKIAYFLPSSDLANFRLSGRAFSIIGASFIPKNGLTVLNEPQDFISLQKVLATTNIAAYTKSLRIIQLEVPLSIIQCWGSQAGWCKTQPAFMRSVHHAANKHESRRLFDDVENLKQFFTQFHNLDTVIVSSLRHSFWSANSQSQYRRLQQAICIAPFHSDEVTETLERIILCSALASNIRTLQVLGLLDPFTLSNWRATFNSIRNLTVQRFSICNNEESISRFLQLFPNLEQLSVSFHGWGVAATIFTQVHWPKLNSIMIEGLWTSDVEFVGIVQRHKINLQSFTIKDCSLTQGSWQNLFSEIRAMRAPVIVGARGELYGRTARETLDMNQLRTKHLDSFMRHLDFPWPFN